MTQTRARGFGFFFILTLAISVAAFGANPNPVNDTEASIGEVSVSASAVQWSASGSYDRLILTVSGPENFSLTKEFEAGRAPSLRLVDLGKVAIDGTYSWEMRLVPRISPITRRQLAAAREAGDEVAASRIQAEAGLNRDFTHSGAFMIKGGAFVDNGATEPRTPGGSKVAANALKPQPNDQVYPDDVIIQGSACVGLDCVNNESFGFDTIRLKENNTRIKFEDTSVGSFPTNDWQLTANDSASGASSKFSIEDITGSKVPFTVTAGASTNSIFVDSTGRVGFRTSTPVLDLHVNTANTPAVRLEQNNSGGFTAQTWDVGANEANFFVRDVTSGSRLPFRIRPGAPTSSVDISADGDTGIGTASPEEKLHVSGSGNVRAFITSTNNLTAGFNFEVENPAGTSVGFGVMRTENNGDMDFFTGTSGAALTERLRILVGGNVGIGTSSPSSKLHVNGGDIRVSGGSFIDDGVTLNVPDYVFDSSHELMPLAKLADFIKTEKHLPNVPSAAHIKANGLNMSQMQMRLLEKVEELTLYTIDLKAENDQLQKRLEAIEQQIKQQ